MMVPYIVESCTFVYLHCLCNKVKCTSTMGYLVHLCCNVALSIQSNPIRAFVVFNPIPIKYTKMLNLGNILSGSLFYSHMRVPKSMSKGWLNTNPQIKCYQNDSVHYIVK